jgi:hypothetical protein
MCCNSSSNQGNNRQSNNIRTQQYQEQIRRTAMQTISQSQVAAANLDALQQERLSSMRKRNNTNREIQQRNKYNR